MTNLEAVYQLGQSIWLNFLRRAYIDSGELSDAVEAGVRGITSSPLIFEKAITYSSDYDDVIRRLVSAGKPVKEIYEALVIDDIQRAADILHATFEDTEGLDGYVTLELNPGLAHDTVGTVAEARHVLAAVNRPNAMIEVPATSAGIAALEALISDGVNVNATHIFSLETYQKVAEAFIRGIEAYINTHSVWRQNPASVASISISPLDHVVDRRLSVLGRPELSSKAGLAVAKMIYRRSRELFGDKRWQKLASRGARIQRPKWTRTNPRSFAYRDTLYLEGLMGADTVCTFSPASLRAFRHHGRVAATLEQDLGQAQHHLAELSGLGIDMEELGRELQERSLVTFERYFRDLISSVIQKRDDLDYEWHRMVVSTSAHQTTVIQAMSEISNEHIIRRIWDHDSTLWKTQPETTPGRPLGWLEVIETMQANLELLGEFGQSVANEGSYREAIVLGSGTSNLAPALFAKIFGPWSKMEAPTKRALEVSVLETTDSDLIRARAEQIVPAETLVVVSSKSGRRPETLSAFSYLHDLMVGAVGKTGAGSHFVAITDPGTQLVNLARRHHFRRVFLNHPNVGGTYSALSYVGLVPAALVGVDLTKLLDRAEGMAINANSCNNPPRGNNMAAQLGAILGRLAGNGSGKLSIVCSPAIASFADWIRQLIVESIGIAPIARIALDTADVYDHEGVFVHLRLAGDETQDQALTALASEGHPLITIHLKDIYDIGGLIFGWQMATAVAGYLLGVQPSAQPDSVAV